MTYKEIYIKLNELALLNDWDEKFDKTNGFLFDTSDDFQTYRVDLKDFTKLAELVEGVEHTPKMDIILEQLATFIVDEIPEIYNQNHTIELQILNRGVGRKVINFNRLSISHFNIFN